VFQMTAGFKSSHDISVEAVFPSRFRLELKDLPPASAMVAAGSERQPDPTEDNPLSTQVKTYPRTADAHGKYAFGSIVAYEDKNGNGRLDLLSPDAPEIDRVLGVNDALVLVYLEGDTSSASILGANGTPVKGYNLLRTPACVAKKSTDGAAPTPCDPGTWLPISTLYELPLTAEPQLAAVMCADPDGSSSVSATKSNVKPGQPLPPAPGPDGWPKKDDENLVCASDGKSYAYFRCQTTSLGLCKGAHETCTENSYGLPSATPPPEWPCAVK